MGNRIARNVLRTALCLCVMGAGCSGCFERAKPGPAAGPAPPGTDPTSDREEVKEFPRKVRRPVIAGSWYPADPAELGREVDRYLAQAEDARAKVSGEVIALISPHAGYSFSGKAAATGYKLLKGRSIRRVVVLAPSHRAAFRGASIAGVTHYETPLGLVPVDAQAVSRLRQNRLVSDVPEADEREHSLEIQLPLLQRVLGAFSLVPLVLGDLDEADYVELAKALSEVVDGKTLVVASSDFTHRGPNYSYEVPEGPGSIKERLASVDQGSIEQIVKLSRTGLLAHANKTGSTICGLRPIGVLLELLAGQKGAKAHLVSHYTSGDVTGDWQSTVTYVGVAVTGKWPEHAGADRARTAGEKVFPLSVEDKRTLLRLARASLDAAVHKGEYDPSVLASFKVGPSLERKAGAFVTLSCELGADSVCVKRGRGLRGCIGTIVPIEAVAETVARRAASAALEDSRFPRRVGPGELAYVRVEVSVLTPPRPVSGAQAIVIGQHGIILEKEGSSATFLPQVAPEQGWDRETTLRHLSLKAGLGPDGWRSGARFQVYEAIVFSEGEAL